MIDGLSVKKSNLLWKNELKPKNLIYSYLEGELNYFVDEFFESNFLKFIHWNTTDDEKMAMGVESCRNLWEWEESKCFWRS